LLTANDFYKLLSRKNVSFNYIFFLDWICLFAFWRKGRSFRSFLSSGDEVMKQLLHLIMKTAPIGLGAYFAYQVGIFGSSIIWCICKPLGLYYGVCAFYFVVFLASMHLREGQMG
jgi:Na+/H+-dicarboxylate symporter